jgi:hypothetical protein
MKFFTREWWENAADADFSVFEKYAAYLESVKASLPPDLLRLEAEHTLHDAEVKFMTSDFS